MSAYEDALKAILLDKEAAVSTVIGTVQGYLNAWHDRTVEDRVADIQIVKSCIRLLENIVRHQERSEDHGN